LERKVVVTGMSSINHLGTDSREMYQRVQGGEQKARIPYQSWVSKDRGMELKGYRCEDDLFKPILQGIQTRSMDRFAQLNIAAVKLALEESDIEDDLENTGYIMNTTFGPWQSTNQYTYELVNAGPLNSSPRLFPNTVLNSAQGQVAKHFSFKGVSSTIAGVSSIAYAYGLIRKGVAQRIIIAGADELNENVMEAFSALGSPVIHGEGVGVLILEAEEYALKRQAPILAEIVDYAQASDPKMKKWFEDADEQGTALTYILSSLESNTGVEDKERLKLIISGRNGSKAIHNAEESSIAKVFEGRLSSVGILSPKLATGETFGAASVFGAITAVHALQEQGDEAIVISHEVGGNQLGLRVRKGKAHVG